MVKKQSTASLNVPDGRNADKDQLGAAKASMQSLGVESGVSLPDEGKIKEELTKLAESEDEDGEMVNKIEEAQKVRLDAEKDDNA